MSPPWLTSATSASAFRAPVERDRPRRPGLGLRPRDGLVGDDVAHAAGIDPRRNDAAGRGPPARRRRRVDRDDDAQERRRRRKPRRLDRVALPQRVGAVLDEDGGWRAPIRAMPNASATCRSASRRAATFFSRRAISPARSRAYEEGLEIRRRLARADPSHAERQRDVSVSLSKTGEFFLRRAISPARSRLMRRGWRSDGGWRAPIRAMPSAGATSCRAWQGWR